MVEIYVDGSGSKEGLPIGYAAIITEDDELIECLSSGEIEGTNNRAELMAVIITLRYLKEKNLEAEIISDSRYVVDGINEFMSNWKLTNFVFVKNPDLWKVINKFIYIEKVKFKIYYIKGHQKDLKKKGVQWNHLADEIAGKERLKMVEKKQSLINNGKGN